MQPLLRPSFMALFLLLAFNTVFSQKKPNIIYIMADDMGYADLSCYGRKDYQTPNLDKLASQGVKFMNAYAAAPVCTPTRTAFMTGRYPARTPVGLYEPLTGNNNDSLSGLSSKYTALPALLKKAGYETMLVGKWHLGSRPEFSPLKSGFDYYFGFNAGAIDYINHRNGLMENKKHIYRDGYMTDLLEEKAVSLIKKHHSRPFFLSLMFNAPHWPWQGPDDKPYPDTVGMASGGSPAIYANMMKSLDNAVGKVMEAIDQAGIADNTVVIFTSDNGGERFSDMGIYKGDKMDLWEGGIREPAFVRWPDKIQAGTTTNQVVTTLDWTATILSLAGGKPDPNFPLDGIDIMPIITGKNKEVDRTLYWRTFQRTQHQAVRDGKWKYLKDEKGEYLFDLEADPAENKNLKEVQPALFESLKNKYRTWEASVLPPVPFDKPKAKE